MRPGITYLASRYDSSEREKKLGKSPREIASGKLRGDPFSVCHVIWRLLDLSVSKFGAAEEMPLRFERQQS